MTNATRYEKAQRLITNGASRSEAYKQAGIKPATFHYYRQRNKPTRKTSSVETTVPTSTPTLNALAFYGSPEALAQIAKSLQ